MITPWPDYDDVGKSALKTLDDILPFLVNAQGPKNTAKGITYQAACPLCEAGNPKGHHLYVTQCPDGKLLLSCQKSKERFKDLLEGLVGPRPVLQDSYCTSSRPAPKPKIIKRTKYEYCNIDGSLAFYKTRCDRSDGSKYFFFESQNGEKVKPDGSIVIYHLELLNQADRQEPIYIVEGEKCADAMMAQGYIAITSCSGANAAKFTPAEINLLAEFKNKIIIPDNDEAGQNYVSLWSGAKVLTLTDIWPDAPAKADIADYFELGKSKMPIDQYIFNPFETEMKIGEYMINFNGIWTRNKKSKSDELTVRICSHPMLPTKRFKDVYSGKESYLIIYRRDNKWKEQLIPAEDLTNNRLLQRYSAFGMIISTGNAKELADFFEECIARLQIELQLVSSRMGWYRDEFVPCSKKLLFFNDEAGTLQQAVKPQGSIDSWIQAVKPIWETVPAACMYLCCAVAAPIIGRCNKDTFVVLLHGKTGRGKTKLLETAASIYGLPTRDGLTFVMNSTTNYMTKTLHTLKNVAMCIDENESRASSKEFASDDDWLYEITSNKGRQRMKQNGSLEQALTWSTVVLINGESEMTTDRTKEGAKNRVIEISLDDYLTDNFADLSQTIKRNYGLILPAVIDEIVAIGDAAALDDELEKRYQQITSLKKDVTPKMANDGAAIMIARDILQKIIGEKTALSDIELIAFLKTEGDVDNTDNVYEEIKSWLSSKDSNLRMCAKNVPPEIELNHHENNGEIIGNIYDGYIGVSKSKLNEHLMEVFGKPFKAYQKALADREYIDCGNDSKRRFYQCKLTVGGKLIQCVKVKTEPWEQMTE